MYFIKDLNMKSVPNKSTLRRYFQENTGMSDKMTSDNLQNRYRVSLYAILGNLKRL